MKDGTALNEIRSRGYWIVDANSQTTEIVFSHVKCQRLLGEMGQQKK